MDCFTFERMPGPVGKSPETLQHYLEGGSGVVNGETDGARSREIAYWEAAGRDGITDAMVIGSAAKFRQALDGLEMRLLEGPYLLGNDVSVLDIAWYIYVLRLRRCGYPLEKLHVRVTEWNDRLHKDPLFSDQTSLIPAME